MTTTRLPKPYAPGELAALYSAARPDVAAAMRFLCETGLRISEACAITSDEARGWRMPPWWCRRRACSRHTGSVTVIGKGDKARRVPLTPEALRAARVMLSVTENRHLFGWTDRGCRWLFAEVGARIGVHCHPHRFRHQFAFDLVESGVTIEVVADLMGHSTVDISRLYYQASDRRLREAMRARGRRRR